MKPSGLLETQILDYPAMDPEGLYQAAKPATLDTIARRNQAGKATFLLSSQPVFAESAQLAYLLCEYINAAQKRRNHVDYKTFFCNSRIEALHGAIKLSRHRLCREHPASNGAVWVYDKNHFYAALFDPLSLGPENALVPQVFFTADLDAVVANPDDRVGVVACLSPLISQADLDRIQNLCRLRNQAFILDTSQASNKLIESSLAELPYPPDIVVLGEELVDYQVPFGAFSMTEAAYQPWCFVDTCFLHSSTYGGNSLVTALARDRLLDRSRLAADHPDIARRLRDIAESHPKRLAAFRRYINPIAPLIYEAAGLDLDIVKAQGCRITVKRHGREMDLLDGIGGAGSNPRGYNPADIPGQVLARHDTRHDYWHGLAARLCGLTGLGRALPAVSGACAVDIAWTLALLANPGKTKIVVFQGNYAGKTLISLNGTTDAAMREPFGPLYRNISYVDVLAEDGAERLGEALEPGDTALVWFEFMQGNDLDRIPDHIMDKLFLCRDRLGYYIGIDEILNGLFRTGGFLSFDQSRYQPDIITFSKGLSDLSFPVSATLVAERLHQRAALRNPSVVARYETLFRNQLGAQIALNGLEQLLVATTGEQVHRVGGLLKTELEQIAAWSPLLKEVRGAGLHLHLVLDLGKFPLSLFGKNIAELLISRLCLVRGGVLQFFCRLLPALALTEAEARAMAAGIAKAFRINRFSLLLFGLQAVGGFLYLLALAQVRSGLSGLMRRFSAEEGSGG